MEYIKRFFSQRNTLILLSVLLGVSTALNVYQYLGSLDPIEPAYKHTVGTCILGDILGMGGVNVFVSKGLLVRPGERFNVTISLNIWDPYTPSKTWNISFELYERTLYGEYSNMPIAEKTAILHKDKDAIGATVSSDPFTLTASPTYGIYIYKVCSGTQKQTWYTMEFAITVGESCGFMPISPEI